MQAGNYVQFAMQLYEYLHWPRNRASLIGSIGLLTPLKIVIFSVLIIEIGRMALCSSGEQLSERMRRSQKSLLLQGTEILLQRRLNFKIWKLLRNIISSCYEKWGCGYRLDFLFEKNPRVKCWRNFDKTKEITK